MKTLCQIRLAPALAAIGLIALSAVATRAQDPRLQLNSLDHLAAKASDSVDVNIDERLMRLAAKVFSPQKAEERDVKKLVEGIKGIYVKSFEFETDGQYTAADVEAIRSQLRGPAWTRLINVVSKKNDNLEVYLSMSGEQINGLALISSDVRKLAVVNIVGPVDLEKLVQLEGQFGVPELGVQAKPAKKDEDEK